MCCSQREGIPYKLWERRNTLQTLRLKENPTKSKREGKPYNIWERRNTLQTLREKECPTKSEREGIPYKLWDRRKTLQTLRQKENLTISERRNTLQNLRQKENPTNLAKDFQTRIQRIITNSQKENGILWKIYGKKPFFYQRISWTDCIFRAEYCIFYTKWFESIKWTGESRFFLYNDVPVHCLRGRIVAEIFENNG